MTDFNAERLLDKDTLNKEVLAFYDLDISVKHTSQIITDIEAEALLDPATLEHEIAISHPGSKVLRHTIELGFLPD